MKRNTFNKALKHLKSTELDEKIQRLNEAPTNSMSGVYSLNRAGFRLSRELDPPRVFYPDSEGNWPEGIPGTPGQKTYTRPAGYWDSGPGSVPAVDWDYVADFSHSDTSTDGFIDPTSGTVLSNLPPDSRHFILGPLVDGYAYVHGYDDYTNIGYIQKDTRQFILLGRIQGYWRSGTAGNAGAGRNPRRQWGGTEDGFTSYNENFTLEMAQWMRDQYVNGTYIKNVSYYYTGGQPQRDNPDPDAPPGSKGGIVGGAGSGGGPGDTGPFGSGSSGGGPNIGTPQEPPRKGGPEDAGFPWGTLFGPKGPLGKFLKKLFGPEGPLGGLTKGLEDLSTEAMRQLQGLNDGLLTLEKVQDTIKDLKDNGDVIPPSDPNGRPTIRPGAKGSPENPIDMPLSKSTIDDVTRGVYQGMDLKELKARIQQNTSQGVGSGGNIGAKGTFNNLAKNPYFDKNGDLVIPDTYGFDPGGDIAEKPFAFGGTVGDLAKELSGALVGSGGEYEAKRQELEKDILTQFDKTTAGIILGAPGRKEPIIHMEKRIPKNQLPKTAVEAEAKKPIKEELNGGLTESRKRIIREVKKPYTLPEYPKQKLKKYKPNFAGKYSPQNTPDVTACKESDEGVRAKNAAGQMWRTKDKYWSRYQSTERMNVIHDQVGHGDQYWEMIVNENQNKKKIRDREVQEHLNILSHERAMLKENPNFKSPFRENLKEQETVDAPNEPLFNKVSKKLKTVIDYPDKPSREGYPNVPPPEMVNGWHPEYGMDRGYYDKLDPQSAASMPHTGNPEIDAKVQKAKRLKEIIKKKA